MRLAALLEPGPARSAALAALAREIRMSAGLCGDRSRALATRGLDAAVNAAQEASSP